ARRLRRQSLPSRHNVQRYRRDRPRATDILPHPCHLPATAPRATQDVRPRARPRATMNTPSADGDARPHPVLTPSALNRLARTLVEDALPQVWVEGELSNVSRPASGHLYFTLK